MAATLKISKHLTPGAAVDTTYTINNFRNFTTRLVIPAEATALPEEEQDKAIIIQFLGPTESYTFEWTIIDETAETTTGTKGNDDEGTALTDVKTAWEQYQYLRNTLRSKGIEEDYDFEIDDGATNLVSRVGKLVDMQFLKSDTEPITFAASIKFIVGDVI